MALLHINGFSDTLGRSAQTLIALPEEPAPGAPLKTLYLLHGMTDDETSWARRSSIERYADERGMAVVMPGTRLGWYTDAEAGEDMFTYAADEVVALSRALLPCLSHRREDTYAAGISMGGYGALKLALKRPEVFSKAASLSGAVDIKGVTALPEPLAGPAFWRDLFGAPEDIPGSENDLFRLAEEPDPGLRPEIYLWCGTEDFLYAMNVRFRERLAALGYRVNARESAGSHEWKYWDREIPRAMDWLLEGEDAHGRR